MRKYILAVLATGALLAADAPKREAAKGEKKLWAAISVSDPVRDLDVQTQDRFMLHFGIVNDGDKTVNPEMNSSQLLINGKELKNWAFLLMNGPGEDRDEALPPGEAIQFGMDFGKYFEEPGIYKVVWKGKDFQSSEIVFRVLPTKK
jgi:hypothetical protein